MAIVGFEKCWCVHFLKGEGVWKDVLYILDKTQIQSYYPEVLNGNVLNLYVILYSNAHVNDKLKFNYVVTDI